MSTVGGELRGDALRGAMMRGAGAAEIAPLLAEDAVLHSPILSTAFEGRRAVADLLSVANDTIHINRCTHKLTDGSAEAFVYDNRIGDVPLQTTILLEFDDAGLIRDVSVFFRPMRALAAFIRESGPALAKSPGAARLMRALGPGVPVMAASVDAVARRSLRFR